MARIVITSWGSHGDVDPFIALAHGLRERGHAPVLAMPAYFRAVVEHEGLPFHAVRPEVDPGDATLVRRIMEPRRGSEILLREILLPAVGQAYEDLATIAEGADLLVSHPATYAAPVVAAAQRLRWVSTVMAPLSFFSGHDLPVFPQVPWLKHAERLGPWAGHALARLARRATRSWSEPVYRLRARLGLPRGGDPIHEGQHSPELVLAIFPRVLAEPQPDWPPHVRITGQLLHDRAHGEVLPPALDAFLEAGDPPLVFTLGTSAVLASGAFYVESLAAARRLGRRAVLLTGRARLAEFGPMPDAIAVDAAPHSLLFPRAAAVVQQCGIGTLGQALRAGRPILCVPFAHDQPDNAYRATRLGGARTLYPSRYRAARAAAELRALLDEPAYAARAAEVAAVVRREDGVAAACAAIEERLAAS